MRLLNTKSLQFEEYFDSNTPNYAILSHRWEDEEVTFQDFRKGKKQDSQGYIKILKCCDVADSRGFQWVWIDTCCIDKKSSAELTEAINSMYSWYERAGECYAYLSDVVWKPQDIEASKKEFSRSVWFTRGWTLQELLAPSSVLFLDRQWRYFGTMKDLSTEISAATGIKYEHLRPKDGAWYPICIAEKMSWASKRVTSRVEDVAYCMMGLFGVNMPLLYGEGEKAFLRLQLEIIKKSDDESIFAWNSREGLSGMLASHPRYFAESGDIMLHLELRKKRFPYVMTSQGLEFQVPYRGPFCGEHFNISEDRLSLALNCWREGPRGPLAVTIKLARFGNIWKRIECDKLLLCESVRDSISRDGRLKHVAWIYIPQTQHGPWQAI